MKPPPDEGPPTDDDGRAYGDEWPFSRPDKRPLLSRAVPVSDELPGYARTPRDATGLRH